MKTFSRSNRGRAGRCGRAGFTLTELLIAAGIAAMVVTGAVAIYVSILRVWGGIDLRMQADQEVNTVMNRLVYGFDGNLGLRAMAYGTRSNKGGGGWELSYFTGGFSPQNNKLTYTPATSNLMFTAGSTGKQTVLSKNMSDAALDLDTLSLNLRLRVELVPRRGTVARREVETEIVWRNQ
jgi:prepilin-type N-terminal cleavage/methylation domain-containing protein